MCGIVGVISVLGAQKFGPKYDSNVCSAFDDMLWADQLRGNDGTGVMCLDSDGKLVVNKAAGGYSALKEKKEIGKIMHFTDTNLFTIGHNRSATKGVKDLQSNAHPFVEGHIALVHNGTLHWVNEKFRDKDSKFDVDSKAAAKAIAQLGIDAAVKEFSGAYAFVWINTKDMSLNVLRNDQRPLGFFKTGNYIFLASEPSLGVWCASRNGIKFDPGMRLEPFEPNQLYTWQPESLEYTKREVKKPINVYSSYPASLEDDWYAGTSGDRRPGTGTGGDEVGINRGRVGSTTFCKDRSSSHFSSSSSSFATAGRRNSAKKERVRCLGANSMESPYSIGEKVIFTASSGNVHKNLTRISAGELLKPHADVVDKHRIMGNTPMKITEIMGDKQTLEGYVAQVYKTSSGYFIFELRDIVKHVPKLPVISACTPMLPSPVPKTEENKVVDIKSGEKMSDCDCCGALTPDSKLALRKRTITDTEKNLRVKLKFNICPTCSKNIDSDETLLSHMTEKAMAIAGGKLQ